MKLNNASAENVKFLYLSNAVGQTNRKQASLRIESTTHHLRICLPVLNRIIVAFRIQNNTTIPINRRSLIVISM